MSAGGLREEASKMSARYEELKGLKNLGQKYAYSDREVMLYAYGIGLGADPMDEKELAFVNEGTLTPRPLKVVPTFASVAAWGSGPGEMNLNRVMVVDGERDITFHQPLPVAARITADSSVLEVYDKGKDKGVVINHQTVLKNEKGEKLATLVASRFARGDGGFGGPSLTQPEPHKMPSNTFSITFQAEISTQMSSLQLIFGSSTFQMELREAIRQLLVKHLAPRSRDFLIRLYSASPVQEAPVQSKPSQRR